MFKKRKLTTMATLALLSSTLLVGCSSSSDDSSTDGGTTTGGPATSAQVLENQNARAAIAMMIDKEAYVDIILNNGSVATDRYTPEGLAMDNGSDYGDLTKGMGHAYNEEKAQELWAAAKEELGFDTVEIDILTYDSDSGKKTGEYIQAEIGALEGLSAIVTNLPFAQKLEKESSGDFDLSFSGWGADYPDPLTFLKTMETGGQYAVQIGYSDSEVDSLIKEAKTLDTTEAYQKYAEAEGKILEDAFLIPIYQRGSSYVEKDYVSGIIMHSWGSDYTYKTADVDKDEKVLNLLDSSDIPTLDISLATNSVSFGVINNVMEGLIRSDENGNAVLAGAESYEVSEDGLIWTFKLNQDSVWSNGESVTAHDYQYSWDRTLDPTTASEYAYIMDDIVSNTAVDDYTFEVVLNRPVAYFAELMSFPLFFPQNQAFVESCGDSYGTALDKQLYNGPFTLTTWKMEDQYAFTKNDSYWDKDAVKLDTINFKIVKDTGTAVTLYKSGEIDRVGLSSEYVDEFKDSDEFKTDSDSATFMLQVNGGNHN
ncbi:MAG: ABC transporter substrate-binding protein [Peptostreptococcaceae bacterium]